MKGRTPMGLDCLVEEIPESITPKFSVSKQAPEAIDYYNKHGFVILDSVIPLERIDDLISVFDETVKYSQTKFYRQQDGRLDTNHLNDIDALINPILNPQALSSRRFPSYRSAVDEIFCNSELHAFISTIMGDAPGVVQGMHFEANSATWDHQDSYYLDGEKLGTMVGAWFALENIKVDAGRFFVTPGSHKWLIEQTPEINMVSKHHEYKERVKNRVSNEMLDVIAPALEKGDVLLWHPFTVHGSLKFPSSPQLTRKSLTAHFIPSSNDFRVWHKRIKKVSYDRVNNCKIYRAKDQNLMANRVLYLMEDYFPISFTILKKTIQRIMIR